VHRANQLRPGLEDLKHSLGWIDSDHAVSGAGESLGEHPSHNRRRVRRRGAVREHELRPFLQVMLDDVRGQDSS